MRSLQLALITFAALLAAALTGCSLKVDIADENTTTAEAPPSVTSEKSRTAVQVAFLVDQKSEPVAMPEKSKTVHPADEPAPPLPTPEPQSRGAEDLESSESDRVSVVVVENVLNYDIDIHRHHDIHYHSEPPKGRGKPAKIRVEIAQKPQGDERCERLMEEHIKRTAMWEARMRGGR